VPVNMIVRAVVVDIRSDNPQPDDTFLVDTNVWYWMTYTRASLRTPPPLPHQTRHYPNYVKQALVHARLLWCGLSMAELAHQIERSEHEIFASRTGSSLNLKEYRHNEHVERRNVIAEIRDAWAQIKTLAAPLDAFIDMATTGAALDRLATQEVDGYDSLLLQAVSEAGVTQVVTDDGDYATVPGLQVFTCNRNVIAAAHSQGKLIQR